MATHYKPDLSVKFSPRVTRRLRNAVERICRRHKMPDADVLRYSFEAAVLNAPRRLRRSTSAMSQPLDAMITVRTSRAIRNQVAELWRSHPKTTKADILRALFESIIPVADKYGMAHVIRIREVALAKLRSG